MKKRLIVISADALTDADDALLRTLPNFQKYLAGGASIKKVRSIYPTITYPCHTTMCTGVYPDKHKIISNLLFRPGESNIPWCRRRSMNAWPEDIFFAAKAAGYTTGAVYWPVTGGHPAIDYLISNALGETREERKNGFLAAGASPEVAELAAEVSMGLDLGTHMDLDEFIRRSALALYDRYRPEVFFIHPVDMDSLRHRYGIKNDKVESGVVITDDFIGKLMALVEEKGFLETTDLILVSDHGQIDIKRVANPNVLLAKEGFLTLDAEGKLADYDVYSQSNGAMALVYLKEGCSEDLKQKAADFLYRLRDEKTLGIGDVFTREEVAEKEHLNGDFSFVLETDGITSFGDKLTGEYLSDFDFTDYRYGKGTHGHLPDKGIQPIFYAKGPSFRDGAALSSADLVDETVTYAKILNVSLADTDGRVLTELLR